MTEQPRIQTLRPADAQAAWALTQQLRWPHRVEDWARFIHWANLQGMACGLVHRQQLIGTALCWHWGRTHANLGLMIIDPAWQQRGLGRRLITHLLAAQAPERSISLMATEAGLPLYRELGFEPLGRCSQYQGLFQRPSSRPDARSAQAVPDVLATGSRMVTDTGIRTARPADLDTLCTFDTRLRGLDRSWMLRALINDLDDHPHQSPGEACAILQGSGDDCRAYGVRRHFGRGWLIGPLVAQHEKDAIALLDWLCAPLEGAFVRIDLGWQPPPAGSGVNAGSAPGDRPERNAGPEEQAPRLSAKASVDAWLHAHGLAIVDQPLAMRRPADHACRPRSQALPPSQPQPPFQSRSHTPCQPAPLTQAQTTGPAVAGFPATPAVLTLISQATG